MPLTEPDREERFEKLMLGYYPKIKRYCRYYLYQDPFACEECIQDVFTVLYQKMDDLTDHAHLEGWLYKTARNFVKNALYRSMRDSKHLQYEDFAESDCAFGDTFAYEENFRAAEEEPIDVGACFDAVLKSLTADELALWKEYFRQGASVREIAVFAKRPEGTIKTRIFRLKAKLKRLARQALSDRTGSLDGRTIN